MKRSGRRILIIVLSIMVIMTYMIPGSVFADTYASDGAAAVEDQAMPQAEEVSDGDGGGDAIIDESADDHSAEAPPAEADGEAIEDVPEAVETEGTEEVTEETTEEAPAEETVTEEEPAPAKAPALRAAANGSTILAFTSDTHNKSGNVAANRLGTWLDKMEDIYKKKVDLMAFGGDMANASASQADFWTLTQADMDQLTERNVPGVYTTGNHEYSPGNYTHNMNSTTQVYIENAEGAEGSNYRIYCLGSSAYAESSGGWMAGWNEYTSSQVTTLTNYLNGVDNSKVIIVITHYPLHFNPQRTITGANNVIDALNTAANSGKKIVYLWGHNHTDADKGANGELNYDKIFKPGDTISYSNGNSKEINFYYGAAGCMSDSEYGTGSGAVKGKGLILEINDENKLTFTYYDANANDVTEGGSYTEKDPVPVQSATIDEASGSSSGQIVTPTVEVRRTLQLHYTTVPEDATVRSITWSSSNEAVATVDKTGKVKGVSEGRATITATISDGITRGTVVASVEIEVLAASTEEPMYVLTDTLEPDKNYIIANANSGEAFALTNNNGSAGLTTVTVEGDVIYTENENIVFSTEGSGSTVTAVGNDGYYLSASNGSLSLTTSAPASRTYTYGTDSKLVCRSGNTSYYIYYSTYNGGRYSASTSATSSSSPREVYLFEEIGEQVAVTGVSVTPKTATVEARKTVPLTATVAPANATNKKVTWSSSNPSVATVDETGKVRGVSEGTATITASAGGFTDTCAVTVTPSTSTEQHYVITVDGNALTYDRSPNQAQGGSSSYTYTGLAGVAYSAGDAAADNIRWILEETEGGYYIKSIDGLYLNATYTSTSNSGQGDLKLDNTPDVWVLDSGASLDSGTIEGTHLKSTNASSTASSDKFIGYEESPANLFTVRSSGNDDEVTISEAEDPVEVTAVSVTPKTATVKARETVQLTATVSPENATNKKVTWTSSNTSVATVDENGKVRGVSEGTATITATAGGKSDTATITVTPGDPVQGYVITIDGFALSTDRSPNQAQGGTSSYTYTGLAGVAYTAGDDLTDNILWTLEETNGGYYIKSQDGLYLNGTYTSGSNSGQGNLKVDSTPDVWVLDGTIEDWMVDGAMLRSTNATNSTPDRPKFLGYEDSANLFTVRSEENADESQLIDPTVTIEERFVETTTLEDGKEYIIAVTKDSGSVYAIRNTAGTGTGNTGSATLTVTPASGSDPAYIETDDIDVVWTYQSSNQYMLASTGSSHYLGYESSTYLPRTSSQGRAIIYSGGKLQITSGHYLTCDNGTFATNTSSSSGANVRLFVKSIVIVDCDHEYGEPVWTWTGSVNTRAAVTATATFTCTKCGEQVVVNADVTSATDSSGHVVYTATAIGPDGKTYTDTKAAAEEGEYTIKITADKEGVSVGDTVTFTITLLGPVDRFGSFQMTPVIPEGLTYEKFEIAEGLKETLGFDNVDWEENYLFFNGFGPYDYSSETDTVLGTLSCTVNSEFSGSATLNISKDDFEVISSKTWESMTDYYTIIPATIGAHTHTAGTVVKENEVAATCEAVGGYDEVVYCTGCGEEMSRTHVNVPALGHDWEFVNFTWTGSDEEGYTAAVANYRCKNDATHTQTVSAIVTSETTAATCEAAGRTVYTATVTAANSLDKTAHTDTKTVGIDALGHDWEFVNFTWTGSDEEGYTAAIANYRCKNDATHTQTVSATVTSETTAATCEAAGRTVYTATVTAANSLDKTAHTDTKTVGIDALGHDWQFVNFTWTGSDEEGYTAAVANYRCNNDATHTRTVNTNVTSTTTEASCDRAGSKVYTTTVEAADGLDGIKRTDTRTVVIPATGHDWGTPVWEWTGNAETGYTGLKGTFTCQNDSEHVQIVETTDVTVDKKDPTPTESGYIKYSAEVTGPDGKEYSDTIEIIIPAEGYTYKDPVYIWTETDDGYSVAALKECNEDSAQNITETVTATFNVTTPATCEAEGEGTYTATFTKSAFETQTKVVTIDALVHDWKFENFTWTGSDEAGYTAAAANYVCKNDATHTQTVNATVTSEITAATCDTDGKTVYTATVTAANSLDGEAHTADRTVAIPATGHDWGEATYGWSDDNSKVIATRTCKNDPTHKETETVDTTSIVTEPTCTAKGKIVYTATFTTVGFEDQTRTIEIDMIAHTPVTDPGKPATCIETGLTEGSHCSVCGEVLVAQEVIPKTSHNYDEGVEIRPPVYTKPGLFRFTCTVCGDVIDIENGWVLEGEWTWRFLKSDGKWAAGEWVYDNKGYCWIKEDGICAIDTWFTDPETGNLYYLEHGGYIARNKWAKDGDEWYYMNADGLITKNGWAKDSKGWCWLGDDGKITKSKWIQYKGEWYYLKADGYMAANEWAKDSKGWMYMDGSGKITKSKWVQYKSEWYYLKADGYMAANEWAKDGKGWMYMDGSGKITKSKWIQYKGDWYYLKADGYMATGTQTIGGVTYRFDSSGKWIS